MVQTRYQSKITIDFDEASRLWRENKKNIGNGMFCYKCFAFTKKGLKCNNKCKPNSNYCKTHKKN